MADDGAGLDVAQLVAEHHQAVYRYAYRLTGSVPDAEDLSQQVFLVAQEKLAQLRKAANARSWLFAILRNCFLKGRQRRRPVAIANLQLNVDLMPAEVPKDEDIDRERLQEALNELSDGFRVVLVMFYFEDCSYREIAEELDLPIGTVMSRLARAKGYLRSRLLQQDSPKAPRAQPSSTQPG
jgi:RNA polymerase sigma-70 factor (ECF subfamily)